MAFTESTEVIFHGFMITVLEAKRSREQTKILSDNANMLMFSRKYLPGSPFYFILNNANIC